MWYGYLIFLPKCERVSEWYTKYRIRISDDSDAKYTKYPICIFWYLRSYYIVYRNGIVNLKCEMWIIWLECIRCTFKIHYNFLISVKISLKHSLLDSPGFKKPGLLLIRIEHSVQNAWDHGGCHYKALADLPMHHMKPNQWAMIHSHYLTHLNRPGPYHIRYATKICKNICNIEGIGKKLFLRCWKWQQRTGRNRRVRVHPVRK